LEEKLMEQVQKFLVERSKKAIEMAKQAIVQEQIKYEPLGDALRYFMEEIWYNAAHPALLSIVCEAVGGDPDATTNISASLVVLTGAADIHDDIIDQSISKDVKLTIFGRFGRDISIIAGDVLWFKGMLMLNEACESFSNDKKQAILELAKQAFFDIGSAEAREANLRRNMDLKPEEYLEIIRMKVSMAEAVAKIGVIVGHGTSQ
jgi:geranylgeranyl pyrophosphate synthase